MANNIIKYLVLDIYKMIGKPILLYYRPYSKYVEGIKGEQEGLVLTCLCENMGYEKVDVKMPGIFALPFSFDGHPCQVEFDCLESKLWQDWDNKGELKLSISAKDVKLVADNLKNK